MIRPILVLLFIVLVGGAEARGAQRCGDYTVTIADLPSDLSRQRLTLSGPGGVVLKVEDAMAGVNWCRDVTADGVPEVLLYTFSGGAHCCFTQYLYSLGRQARRLLELASGDVDTMQPEQLDGGGPLELVSGDERFAYAYGLSFADSPFLPVVYAFRGGRYLNDSRAFPGVLLKAARAAKVGESAGGLLEGVGAYLAAGQVGQAKTLLAGAAPDMRAWLESYLPDIRQDLADYGMEDWPARAGLKADSWGTGASFSAPGLSEYAVVTAEPGGGRALRLFRRQGSSVVASAPLASVPKGDWRPDLTVRRAGGRDDLIVRDATSGSVSYAVYRLDKAGAQVLRDDSLGVFVRLLADLTRLANVHERLLDNSVRRTPQQVADLNARAESFSRALQTWPAGAGFTLDPDDLAYFDVHAVEAVTDGRDAATWRATLDMGTELDSKRYELRADLQRAPAGWQLLRWSVQELIAEPPLR